MAHDGPRCISFFIISRTDLQQRDREFIRRPEMPRGTANRVRKRWIYRREGDSIGMHWWSGIARARRSKMLDVLVECSLVFFNGLDVFGLFGYVGSGWATCESLWRYYHSTADGCVTVSHCLSLLQDCA